jgi:alpha-1,2-mannosyltransferase
MFAPTNTPVKPRTILVAAGLGVCSVIAPIGLWLTDSKLIGSTYGKDCQLFELFGLTAGAALIALAIWELMRTEGERFEARLVAVLPLALALYWVGFVSEFGWFKGDWWSTYQRGAAAIAAGRPLYSLETTYIFYPPFIAEVLLTVQRMASSVLSWYTGVADADRAWWVTFYLFQTAQVALIVVAYRLLLWLARRAGAPSPGAEILAVAVLVLNNPLSRAVRWGQVNVWILDLTLLGFVLSVRSPLLAGIALAVAIHIKLYPLIVLVPLLAMGRWRPIVWTLVAAGGIAGAEVVRFGTSHWRQFLGFVPDWPTVIPFRSNSVLGVVSNTLNLLLGIHGPALEVATKVTLVVAAVAALGWYVARAVTRERVFRRPGPGERCSSLERADGMRIAGHAADGLAFGLLVSPLAWEHHYVFAIPLVVLAGAALGRRRTLPVLVAAALAIGFPTYDVFAASYVRIVGLVMLLAICSPRAVAASAPEPERPATSAGS